MDLAFGARSRPRFSRPHSGVRPVAVALLLQPLLWAVAAPAWAHPGDLDLTFGMQGKVTSSFGSVSYAYAVAMQADGKIVTAGFAGSLAPSRSFVVARYEPTGALDQTFGKRGLARVNFGGDSEAALAVAVQPDGKVVAAGEASVYTKFAVARFNLDGSLDGTFSADGKRRTTFPQAVWASAHALALQPDGKIVVAGGIDRGGSSPTRFAMARFQSDGTLDGNFGVGGRVIAGFGKHAETAYAAGMGIQSDGKIVLTGELAGAFGVMRFNSDGTLDGTFGVNGRVITPFSGSNQPRVHCMALQPDGKIIVVGETWDQQEVGHLTLVRYRLDGKLDATFGDGGIDLITGPITGYAVALLHDGRIVVAGEGPGPDFSPDFGVARLTPDGALDPGFGSGGIANTDFNPSEPERANAVAIQDDGKIVAAGEAFGRDWEFALARYLDS